MPAKTATATAPRRRTRKSTATVKVTKYTKPSESKTMTETPQPIHSEKVRPTSPKLSLKDYRDDFVARVEIHNYEVDALISDIKNGIKTISPYVKQAIDYSVDAYQKVSANLSTATTS
mgnify:CR=1 FL=1